MKSESIKADFLAARSKTVITIMNASGWRQGVINSEFVGVDSVFFYVVDYETKWIWCCSVPKEAFFALIKESESKDKSALVSYCSHMIEECACAIGLNQEMEKDLAIGLTAYIGITEAYQLTEKAAKENHFGVIRYGLTNIIRPFAMKGSARHLLPVDVIRGYMNKVVSIDLSKHPEWMSK